MTPAWCMSANSGCRETRRARLLRCPIRVFLAETRHPRSVELDNPFRRRTERMPGGGRTSTGKGLP